MRTILLVATLGPLLFVPAAFGQMAQFVAQEIDAHVGKVCYALAVADVSGDGKSDIVAVTEDAVVWYENPGWSRRDIIRGLTEKNNVCIEPHDIDGDGRIDFAIGAGWRPTDAQNPSTLQWLGRDQAGTWKLHPIRYQEPTLHRLRWGDVKGTGKKQLVVASLQGRGTKPSEWGQGEGAAVLVLDVPDDRTSDDWPVETAEKGLHTIHSLQLVDMDKNRRDEILLAAWEGVFRVERSAFGKWSRTQLGTGNQETSANKGASEVKLGRTSEGMPLIATIEPWHGFQVVVYSPPSPPGAGLWDRQVVAQPVQGGQAVWWANLDDDDDLELIIGQREANPADSAGYRGPGVLFYDIRRGTSPPEFELEVVDDGGMACEDALAADLDGDGRNDIIAGGRATHNVKIYWNHYR
jgi:hypothetical protein